jgi:Na+-transporting methylmalonyl-CoA/oxaloacetate decarboxylase gamma subunit
MENISQAIFISILGMGLVFAIILLLWGLIALVSRLGARLSRSEQAPVDLELEHKRLAAAVAVAAARAIALAAAQMHGEEIPSFPMPPTAVVSPWQAVNRSKILNRQGQAK